MPSPDRVGPYLVLARLGAGGMGEVFLAEDPRLRRQVALKSVSERWAQRPEARRRLLREARAAAALNHPGIAAVYDVVESAADAYIVMEYVPGETLAATLQRGPVSVSTALFVGAQLCDALAAAHAQGLLHRDVKPSNVVLTPDGRVKVLDFGLARSLTSEDSDESGAGPSAPARGRVAGTPAYIPPERYEGASPSEAEDVYSTGVLLYEILSGRRPFDGPDVAHVAAAVLDGRPTPLRSVAPGVPAPVAALVERAMARRPGDRPPTARAMRDDLQRLRALDEQTTATSERVVRPRGSLPWLAAIAGVVVLLAAGVSLRGWSRAAEPSSGHVPVVLVLPFASSPARSPDDPLGTGVADVVVSALSRVPRVNVLSLSAGRECARQGRDVECARSIGASYVLAGTLQRQRDELRVTLSLVNGTSRVVAWSESYDGALDDLFAFQRRVAEGVSVAFRRRFEAPAVRREPLALADRLLTEYGEGLRLLERRDEPASVDRAIALFEGIVLAQPRFALAEAALGRARWAKFEETRDVAESTRAEAALRSALEIETDLPGVLVAQATILRTKGSLGEAEEVARRAVAAQPDSDEVHAALGEVLVAAGKIDAGLAELRRAVELRGGFWQYYDAIARAEYGRGNLQPAIDSWRTVVELRPDSPWGYVNLGAAFYGLGDRANARANLERAVLLRPDPDALSNLGFLAYEEKRFGDAESAFRKAVDLQPKDAGLQRNLGDALSRLGREAEAERAYSTAAALQREQVRVKPDSGVALAELALYEAKAGQVRDALAHARRASQMSPQSSRVAYVTAVAYALCGATEKGVAAYRSAERLGYNPEVLRTDEDLESVRVRPHGESTTDPLARKETSE
ncbi:MAG: protein kinase [Vicinamibacteria bacterium]